MKEYTLIFDFDGTIADTLSLMVMIFNRLAPKYHYMPVSEKDVARLRGISAREVIGGLKISKLKLPLVYREGRKAFQSELSTIKPFLGIKEVLTILQKEYTLGIVTSNTVENVKTFTQKNELEIFDFIYSDKSIFGKGKILKKLLKTYSLPQEKVIYIGDEVRDIDAAQESGIRIVSVTWGYNTKDVLVKHKPDLIVDVPNELSVGLKKIFN